MWQGRLVRVTAWYWVKWAARAEIDQMGRSMNLFVLQGRVFVLRGVWQ